MNLWRISKYADLSGRGGLVVDGRWHRKGIPVVYSCDHPSTALLEILVHVDKSRIPPDFQLLRLECPDDLEVLNSGEAPGPALTEREVEAVERVAKGNIAPAMADDPGLPHPTLDWYLQAIHDRTDRARHIDDFQLIGALMNSHPISLDVSQAVGTSLLQKRQVPLIRVRSAVMPAAWNYLINPLHPDAARITVAETFQYPFDSRLLR
tara:strand:+ start:861 stop:1484 length:624 start_codon:yes stop_codon:yes gene_type:complete